MTQSIGVDGRIRDDKQPQNAGYPLMSAISAPAGTSNGSVYNGLTAAQTLLSFTTDNMPTGTITLRQRYRISVTIDITTLGSGAIQVQISYTDESGTARTRILTLIPVSGVDTVTANTAADYVGTVDIITNPNTAVAVATIGTFTGCTYNAQASCEQLLRQ